MNAKFYISKIKIGRKTVDSINTGTDLSETAAAVERIWDETHEGAKVIAIRELTAAEVKTVQAGEKVAY